jgi:hypothetical protein
MWRCWWLAFSGAAIGVSMACGGGGDSGVNDSACGLSTEDSATLKTLSSRPLPRVSLDAAQDRVQFDLVLPDQLPPGAEVGPVVLFPDPGCPEERVERAEISITGDDYAIILMETEGSINLGGSEEAIRVNGVDGEIERHPGGGRVSVSWKDEDGLGYSAVGFLGGALNEARFLEVLESIPE